MAEDVGWSGAWDPHIVNAETLAHLKNMAGEPIMGKGGKPLEWVRVNLRTGEFIYTRGAAR